MLEPLALTVLLVVSSSVEAVTLSKSDINDARQSGNFHFSLTETWGSPYDPHTYASGWIDGLGGEGVFPAMVNFAPGSSRAELLDLIKNMLRQDERSVLEGTRFTTTIILKQSCFPYGVSASPLF